MQQQPTGLNEASGLFCFLAQSLSRQHRPAAMRKAAIISCTVYSTIKNEKKRMKGASESLTNAQLGILKACSFHLNEEELKDFKEVVAPFFAKGAVQSANQTWDREGWNDKPMRSKSIIYLLLNSLTTIPASLCTRGYRACKHHQWGRGGYW